MMTSYRFRPGWVVSLATLVVFPVLVGLGIWQLQRAQEKIELRDRYTARGAMPPIDINEGPLDPQTAAFRRATVKGRYRPDRTIYLDNKVLNGVPGYEILTPLGVTIPGSDAAPQRFILINRGWVSWGETRESLPDIGAPRGVIELSGRLRRPPQEYFTLADDEGDGSFHPRWQNLDLEQYREVTGLPVSPLVLELTPAGERGGELVRQWQRYDDPWIHRHRAYAVQWFALALVVLVLYGVLNLEKRNGDET